MEASLKQSAGDLLARGLGDKSRARQSSRRSGIIDLVNERLVERNIDPYGSTGIGKQRNGEQHGPPFNSCFDILVTKHGICDSCWRKLSAGAFQRLSMLTKRCRCIHDGFFQGFAGREAPFDVRKPDTKGAVGLFFDNRYEVRRHCFDRDMTIPPHWFLHGMYA
jgi:hypothetical protein